MSQRKSSFGKISKGKQVRGSVFTSAVVVEGYLKKHSTGIIKRWQKRYFAVKVIVLLTTIMYYLIH
jgi:hypothetical protein